MEEFIEIGSASLFVDRRGPTGGEAAAGGHIVFLHAGVADRRMWSVQLAALASAHQVVAYDRRGFGNTRYRADTFSHVEDLLALLNHLQLEKVMLVGCSQGGRIAVDFALQFPDRVSGMVLIAPAISGEDNEDFDHPAAVLSLAEKLDAAEASDDMEALNELEAQAWLDGPMSAPGRVGGDVRRLFLDMNAIALRAAPTGRELEPEAAMAAVRSLDVPALVLWGELDFPHVMDLCQRLAAQLPNAKAVVIPDCAHLPSLEQPAMVSLLIEQLAQALPDFSRPTRA